MKMLLLVLADHVLTFALLKASVLVLATWAFAAALRRAAPAVRATVWWAGACSLIAVPFAAAVAGPLLELSILEFPQVLFQRSAADLVGAGATLLPGEPATGLHAPLAAWFAGLWIVGFAAFAGSFAMRVLALRRVARRALPARDARAGRHVEEARRKLGVRRTVRVVYSAELGTPLTFGWLRPTVLLPARARHWDDDRFAAVVSHELAHIRRHDWVTLVALEMVRALHWANPLVWVMVRRARQEQELASDHLVLELGVPARAYADHVLALARDSDPRHAVAVALPFARRATLRARIEELTRGHRTAPGIIAGPLVPITAALGLAFFVGSAELWVCDKTTTPAHAEAAPVRDQHRSAQPAPARNFDPPADAPRG